MAHRSVMSSNSTCHASPGFGADALGQCMEQQSGSHAQQPSPPSDTASDQMAIGSASNRQCTVPSAATGHITQPQRCGSMVQRRHDRWCMFHKHQKHRPHASSTAISRPGKRAHCMGLIDLPTTPCDSHAVLWYRQLEFPQQSNG